ncbi:hypothetical protein J5X84_44720 [Streptosporangiaceae bacterium NEAU-GS5]|nr:hypothetical protein [Streptosporangiaceae bacterium NEAU-GS5]
MLHRRMRTAALAGLAFATVLGSTATGVTAAQASAPNNGPTAVISLGDSYMSGEGGRRQGNIWVSGAFDDLKEASVTRGTFDAIYRLTWHFFQDGVDIGGCHRSDVPEINGIPGVESNLNIACSGALTTHVWSTVDGGSGFKGTAPQAEQLKAMAQVNQVKAVVVSIGGNDMGFGSIIDACTHSFVSGSSCKNAQEAATISKVGEVEQNVTKALHEIRLAMSGANYSASDYQLIVQNYPTPIADSNHDMDGDRWLLGCPIQPQDTDWVVSRLMPRLEGAIRHAAATEGARFLNLRDAFKGHELCAAGAQRSPTSGHLVDPNPQPPDITHAEWVNQMPTNTGPLWGYDHEVNRLNESYHPNAFGQKVFQKCLALMFASTGDKACVNTPGVEGSEGTGGISLQPSALPTGPDIINENKWYQTGFCKDSANGYTHLCFEGDGNLRIYAGPAWQVVWATNVVRNAGNMLILQNDGQLVIYGPGGWRADAPNGNAKWASGNWGNPGSYLQVGGKGIVEIFNAAGFSTWGAGHLATPPHEGPPGS